jgi:hypothetical protein
MTAAPADLAERSQLMVASFPRRAVLAVALTVALSLPSVVAASSLGVAGSPQLRTSPAGSALVGRLWSWFAAWWPDESCGADPDGACIGSAPAPRLRPQESCGLDPNGQCGSLAPKHGSSASILRP